MDEGNGRYNLRPRRDLAAERRAQEEREQQAAAQRLNERRARRNAVARRADRAQDVHYSREEQLERSRRFRAGERMDGPPAQRRRLEAPAEVVDVGGDESGDESGDERGGGSGEDALYNSDGERVNEDGQLVDSEGDLIGDGWGGWGEMLDLGLQAFDQAALEDYRANPEEYQYGDLLHLDDGDDGDYEDHSFSHVINVEYILDFMRGRLGRGRGRYRHRGSSGSMSAYTIDTLPYPTPPSKTIDLTAGNMPARGYTGSNSVQSKALHFADTLVDNLPPVLPGYVVRSYNIFLSSYCKDSWQGLEVKATQVSLEARCCRVYCSPVTAEMLKLHYPALYHELIPKLLTVLEPNRCHVLTPVNGDKNLIVQPISVPDTFPGYTMYIFMYNNKTYLHTGVNGHLEDTRGVIQTVKELVTKVDYVYVDTALYFPAEPGWDQTLKKELTPRSDSISKVSVWVQSKLMVVPKYNDSFYHSDDEEENYNYISVRFRTGMEMFIVRLVEKVHQWQDNTRFCFTRDVYELCFAELLKVLPLPHSDHVKVVDLLYERNLSKRTADLFFYTEESADYNDLYNEDEHHCHLRVVYDLHPCMKLINRQFCSVMYTKDTGRVVTDEREKSQYIALYPSHPTKKQVDELITGLRPSEVYALGTAAGVGAKQLTDHFINMTKNNPGARRPPYI